MYAARALDGKIETRLSKFMSLVLHGRGGGSGDVQATRPPRLEGPAAAGRLSVLTALYRPAPSAARHRYQLAALR